MPGPALPIPRPGKIIAAGLNYRDHAQESASALPERPVLFAKLPSCLIGPGEPVVLPAGVDRADYEAELAVIIGRTAWHVGAEEALDYVSGYIVLNDITDRAAQEADGQWTRSKSYDTFGPIGPRLVPAAEVPDPQALQVKALLNGKVMQDASTADMIFTVAELIAYVSATITLNPGDLISTGTPSGVGAFREVPVFLSHGDEITVEVSGIGSVTNRVVAA